MKMKNVSEDKLLDDVKEEVFTDDDEDDNLNPLRCWDCNVNFTTKFYLYKHLFHHIKQPTIRLVRTSLPPLKITLKNTRGNSFEIVNSPNSQGDHKDVKLEESATEDSREGHEDQQATTISTDKQAVPYPIEEETAGQSVSSGDQLLDGSDPDLDGFDAATLEDINGIIENETRGGDHHGGQKDDDMVTGPIITEVGDDESTSPSLSKSSDNYDAIPGAEPTPPPEPSPDSYPKIRIKTTGLLKDPLESTCTITEITDDNPNGDPMNDVSNSGHLWSTPSLEDPLKLPDADDNILSLFNNNDRAKDYGFTSSDSEYMPLDRLDNRGNNSGAMQLYTPTSSGQNSLDSLTGLPMQALAQQVSRLQPSGSGMHQQNVLINIQQFPQAPPQPAYQPPPMYHHSGQPMYQPYQYQPPNPMYYPPSPAYPPPPQHMQQPPPLNSMNQPSSMGGPAPMIGQPPPLSQPQIMPAPPVSQVGGQMGAPGQQQRQGGQGGGMQQQQQQQGAYNNNRPQGPRVPPPRQPMPGQRMQMGGQRPGMAPRGAPMGSRQRVPMTRPRAPMPGSGMRPGGVGGLNSNVRPRVPGAGPGGVNSQFRQSPIKRGPEPIKQEHNAQMTKKKRFDMLTPDKDDDDCQVICMQPKNSDLPQIESVQGGTPEPAENSIMHLSDSITLSVRNPAPKPTPPKKSEANAVANILATRGITVTPAAKSKENGGGGGAVSPTKASSAPPAPPLNLNGAVSIIPSSGKQQQQAKKSLDNDLPTVDLTDDAPSSKSSSPQKPNSNLGLPYRCFLCPAQYPNALGLSKHRQNYHKATGNAPDMAIPLINLKQAGIMQRLGQLGICNFIPLPNAQVDGNFAVPIITTRNPGNVSALGATNMLVLGQLKSIPRPTPAGAAPKPTGPQQQK